MTYRQEPCEKGVEMRRIDSEMDAVLGLSNAAAREKATRLLIKLERKSDRDMLIDLLCDLRRAEQKRRSDRVTDPERRILVGARLPRQIAEQYRARAREEKLSLYAWCCKAFRREYEGRDG